MTVNAEVAREQTPLVSKTDLFDSLMTISFLTKALAEKVLLLSSGSNEGGDFYQNKGEEIKKSKMTPNPVVKLPSAETFNLTKDEEKRLSDIINELNSKTGKTFDSDVAIKAALQIKDLMLKNPDLVASAKNNTIQDFNFSYLASIDDALIEGLSQNQEFFTMLLNNESIKKDVLGIFLKEIYDSLREKKD